MVVRIDHFYSNNYVEYECNGDRRKTLSIKEYTDEIKPYLEDIINNLKPILLLPETLIKSM